MIITIIITLMIITMTIMIMIGPTPMPTMPTSALPTLSGVTSNASAGGSGSNRY